MLLYLTSETWTRGIESPLLAAEVLKAMDLGVHILLAHEMPGVGGQAARHAVDFPSFFSTTPQELLRRGLYSHMAVPLKGGVWREVSALRGTDSLAAATRPVLRPPFARPTAHAARPWT